MINYNIIAQSIEFYEKKGFIRLEAPWWVSKDIMSITAPLNHENDYFVSTNNKFLVASGEQSFLYMASKGRLLEGKFQTVTPCFRNESIGRFSKKCFLKNELIITGKVNEHILNELINTSLLFFKTIIPTKMHDHIKIIKTNEGYDINLGNIEIGSYGIRECEILKWIYGTGCAEPRLTRAIMALERK